MLKYNRFHISEYSSKRQKEEQIFQKQNLFRKSFISHSETKEICPLAGAQPYLWRLALVSLLLQGIQVHAVSLRNRGYGLPSGQTAGNWNPPSPKRADSCPSPAGHSFQAHPGLPVTAPSAFLFHLSLNPCESHPHTFTSHHSSLFPGTDDFTFRKSYDRHCAQLRKTC